MRSPPLGLALILAGLHAVSDPLRMLADMLVGPAGWIGEVGAVTLLQVAAAVLQIVTGVACIRRSAAAWGLFFGYGAATIALAIVTVITIGADLPLAPRIGFVVEIVGAPVVIGVVAAIVPTSESRLRLDGGAVLVGLGVSAWLATPVQVASTVLWMKQARGLTAGTVAGQLSYPAVALAIGYLAFRAGRRLVRGPADVGQRAMRVYVVAAIALKVALAALATILTLLDTPHYYRYLIATQSITVVLSISTPLAIWWYVRGAVDDRSTQVTSPVLAWIALLFVPTLLARLTYVGLTDARVPRVVLALAIAGGGCLAVIFLRAAFAILRGTSARVAALTGAIVAAILFAIVVIAVFVEKSPATQPIGQLALVVATAVTMAWLTHASRAD